MNSDLLILYILRFWVFLSFTSVYGAASYSKALYQSDFGVRAPELGVIDAVHNVTGILSMMAFVYVPWFQQNLLRTTVLGVIMWAGGFTLVPLAHYMQIRSAAILYISTLCYGSGGCLCHLPVIMILHRQKEYETYINSKNGVSEWSENKQWQKAILGVWSNHYNVSLIISEPLFDWAVYGIKIGWQISIIFWSVILFAFTMILYFKFHSHPAQTLEYKVQSEEHSEKKPIVSFLTILHEVFCNQYYLMTLTIYVCLKLMNNHVITVFPYFFVHVGMKGNEGKLVSIYFVAAFLGSFLLNAVDFLIQKCYHNCNQDWQPQQQQRNSVFQDQHKRLKRQQQVSTQSKKIDVTVYAGNLLMAFLGLFTVLMFLGYLNMTYLSQRSFWICGLCVACLGLFMGGLVNYSHTSLLIELLKNENYQSVMRRSEDQKNEPFVEAELSGFQNDHTSKQKCFQPTDFENGTIALFIICRQLFSMPGFIFSFKIIEIDASSYLWLYGAFCMVVFVGQLYRNLKVIQKKKLQESSLEV